MEKTWIILIAIVLFLLITFLYWKMTRSYVEKTYGEKMFKQWGPRTFYWTSVLFVSGGITVLSLLLLRSINVLTF